MADNVEVAKDALAVEFGRRGGKARMRNLNSEQRSDIARRAARARWAKKHGAPPPDAPDPKGPHRNVQYSESGIPSNTSAALDIRLNSERKPAVPVSVNSSGERGRASA